MAEIKWCKDCKYLKMEYEHHPHNGIYWLECKLTGEILHNGWMDKKDYKGDCGYTTEEIRKSIQEMKKEEKAEHKRLMKVSEEL